MPSHGSSDGCKAVTRCRPGSGGLRPRVFAEGGPAEGELLREMMRGFPLFTSLLRNVEFAMAKADFAIARLYADLVTDTSFRDRVFAMLLDEFERTRRHRPYREGTAGIAGKKSRNSRAPCACATRMSIALSLIQVDLLRRKRKGDEDSSLDSSIGATMNGIAAGLHNTG